MKERRIYFDHAATTAVDEEVFEKMKPYFTDCFGNADSVHSYGRNTMSAIDFSRDQIASLLNADRKEIYFTSGGTESDNWALLGAAFAARERGRNHILVSAIEHHAALESAERLKKLGFNVEYLPVNKGGSVELNVLKEKISSNTAMVAVMGANNETGVLQPIEECAALAHEKGTLFFTDLVQYAPYKKIDVKKLDMDMASLSAHKFYGPKGCGLLYVKHGVQIKNLIVGGEQERGLRGGTINSPLIVGFAEAYKKAVDNMESNNAYVLGLRNDFIERIFKTIDGVCINGNIKNSVPSIVNLKVDGVKNTELLRSADLKGIAFSAGSACVSSSIKPSHVLMAMGLSEIEAESSVRLSFGKDNTKEEIEYAVEILKEIINKIRLSTDSKK